MSEVGARIRRERLRRQPPLKLADLAGDELSVGLVSKIERGRVNPSLATLTYLAGRLDLPLAALFEDEAAAEDGKAARGAAQVLLLLGDTGAALDQALAAAAQAGGSPLLRARLLGIGAEALLAMGNVAAATDRLVEASALLVPSASRSVAAPRFASPDTALAQVELGWVLGLLERRRGDPPAAERSWGHCLDALDALASNTPTTLLLRAQVLAELGSLHEVAGATETARNFLARASAVAAKLADPERAARALLAEITGAAARAATGQTRTGRPAEDDYEPNLASALALAAAAAGKRLAERLASDLARVERLASPWPGMTQRPDVPHSRHLR